MTQILKTLLQLLSVIVLCSAMAACTPSDDLDAKFGGHYTSSGISAPTAHSILD